MPPDLQKSVLLITGSDSRRIGTGFAIHQDEQKNTYLLTCRHVVEDVGGEDSLKIDRKSVKVVASDSRDGFDLAVLCVNENMAAQPLELRKKRRVKHISVTGWYFHGNQPIIESIDGTLVKKVGIKSDRFGRTDAWHLKINDDNTLEPGYSGAPVIDVKNKAVIGIVNSRRGEGKKGLVISIEALNEVWKEMPSNLIRDTTDNISIFLKITLSLVFLSLLTLSIFLIPKLNIINVEGTWVGELDDGKYQHEGKIHIKQNGKAIEGTLIANKVNKDDTDENETEFKEHFTGKIQGRNIILKGEQLEFLEKGDAFDYELDCFELTLSSDEKMMTGIWYEKNNSEKRSVIFKKDVDKN